mgnify:CR=1 FL=1
MLTSFHGCGGRRRYFFTLGRPWHTNAEPFKPFVKHPLAFGGSCTALGGAGCATPFLRRYRLNSQSISRRAWFVVRRHRENHFRQLL